MLIPIVSKASNPATINKRLSSPVLVITVVPDAAALTSVVAPPLVAATVPAEEDPATLVALPWMVADF